MSFVEVRSLTQRYGDRVAVDQLSLQAAPGQILALLGPNGSGKTTLFRVLSTLVPIQQGEATIGGLDLRRQAEQIRRLLGVVFQSPSLDKQLTVAENLRCQAGLYGLSRQDAAARSDELLATFGLAERRHDRVDRLSGGLRRRVELAKCLLHRPRLLLLDEPSTGLDPGARQELWTCLERLRDEAGATVILTTHLFEEADRTDQLAIMHRGRLAAHGTPAQLRDAVGGDCLSIVAPRPDELARAIAEKFDLTPARDDGTLRLEVAQGHVWLSRLAEAFPAQIESMTYGKPTLADVFFHHVGEAFGDESEPRGSVGRAR